MQHTSTDITILAAPFGFGPLGKALAIAHRFEDIGLSVKILSDSVPRQIIEDSGIMAGEYSYRQPLDLSTLNSKLVISCLDISTPIRKSGIPLVFVDSLFWLRGVWERLPHYNADAFLAQRFFLEAPLTVQDAVGVPVQMIDAILPKASLAPVDNNHNNLIVFYPGGMRSPYLDLEYQEKYLLWVVSGLVESLEAKKSDPASFIAVIPPHLATSEAAKMIEKYGSTIMPGSGDFASLLRRAKCLIVAPGIEIMLESCAAGKIPYFLPAYNGSHIPQLIAYRKAGVGVELCPSYSNELTDLEAGIDSLSKLSIAIEHKNIHDLLMNARFKEELTRNIKNAISQSNITTNRYPLGKDGAAQVVDISLKLL